jgi:hypothetical protein
MAAKPVRKAYASLHTRKALSSLAAALQLSKLEEQDVTKETTQDSHPRTSWSHNKYILSIIISKTDDFIFILIQV